jgi:pyruvate-formate lyase-activating enzyme
MGTRSRIALGVVVKNFRRLAKHPWIGTKLATLQGEKWLFNLLNPRAKTGWARQIRQLSFRITDLCNLRCHTCGQWGDQGFLHGRNLRDLKKNEVSLDRYLEVLQDLVHHGHHPFVYLWGGEPMLYEGSLELIERAAAFRLPTAIATNGTRIAAAAERLVRAPMFLLQLSIDGPDAARHNQARPGVGGADNFGDIQAGLAAVGEARRAHRSTLPLIASLTTISQHNFRHLVDIYESFRDKVDLFVFYLSWWIDAEGLQAHEADFSRRFGFIPERPRGWVGGWRPDDYQIDHQLQTVLKRSRQIIPPSPDPLCNQRTTFAPTIPTTRRVWLQSVISIFQAVEVNSNGDLSPAGIIMIMWWATSRSHHY